MPAFRTIRAAPLTVALVWGACGVFLATHFTMVDREISVHAARRACGAVVPLTKVRRADLTAEPTPIEGLSGPFDVWNSESPQWWRYWINSLHHGDLVHLLMNGWGLLILGRIIEPRMRRPAYFAFLTLAALVTMLPDALWGNYAIGLSGVAYAMVGLLMVWRDRDPGVARDCPRVYLVAAGIWLLLAQFLTYFADVPIANMAHFAGLIYGWMWGQAYCADRERILTRFLFATGHLLIVPAIWFVIHPFWNGVWHWYLATEPDVHLRRRLERLQTAVLLEPGLVECWQQLAAEYEFQDRDLSGFRAALAGLKANRDNPGLRQLVAAYWIALVRANREHQIEPALVEVFGEESPVWSRSLQARVRPELVRASWTAATLDRLFHPKQVLTSNLRNLTSDSPEETPPGIDPDAPDSALEGERM
jgi:membrane associated rhomboid family serine protease